MSEPSRDVPNMSDVQVFFAAEVFKNLNEIPDVNWDKLAKALDVEPDYARLFFKVARKTIALKEKRAKAKAEKAAEKAKADKGKKTDKVDKAEKVAVAEADDDDIPWAPTFDPLAWEKGDIDCGCVPGQEDKGKEPEDEETAAREWKLMEEKIEAQLAREKLMFPDIKSDISINGEKVAEAVDDGTGEVIITAMKSMKIKREDDD